MYKKILAISLLFILINFSKVHAETFTFAALGDIGARSASTRSLQVIKDKNLNFTLAIGDMSYNDVTPESAWCNYVKNIVGSTHPFEIVAGNHEDDGKMNGYIMNFATCLPDRLNSIGIYGAEYYFDYPANNPTARFILVSAAMKVAGVTYNYNKGGGPYTKLSNWIDDARNKNIKWVIVGTHKNCITVGSKPCEIGEDFMNLLIEKKVDLILQGHDHTYQRSKQLAYVKKDVYEPSYTINDNGDETVYQKGRGPILVIAGNPGGQSMYDISNSDPEKGYLVKALGNNTGIDFRTGTIGYETGRGIVTYSVSDTELTETYNMTTVQVKGLAFSDSFKITSGPLPSPSPSPSPSPTPTIQYYTDINQDGKLDFADIVTLIKLVFN